MSKAKVYSPGKKTASSISLPKEFDAKENMYLLAQAIRVYENKKHPSLSKTQTRAEVTASTRKIYRQKGLGLARHGAKSAPIFVKGGIAHGPRGLKRKLTLPKKMKKKALSIALSMKAKEGNLAFATGIEKIKKTKEAQKLLDTIVEKEKKGKYPNKITLALSSDNKDAVLYFRNLEDVEIVLHKNLNAYNVFYAGFLVIDKDAVEGKKTKKKETKKKESEKKTKKKSTKKTKKSKTKSKKKGKKK